MIRNTYSQLRDTTLKTWQDWFRADDFGVVNQETMIHVLRTRLDDDTVAEMEVLFRPLDRPGDIQRVLSMELTSAWVNEAREIPKGLIDALADRVGRYPAMKDGGCTQRGIIMDTNAPDDDHWWYQSAEVDTPPGWKFFRQPGGLIETSAGKFIPNPKAENLDNLEPNYYMNRVSGKTPEHIRVYYCAQYGFLKEGKPVIPEYVDSVHCSSTILEPIPDVPILVGLDFGLTPAAVFGQRLPMGRYHWFDELVTEDMGAVRFAELLNIKIHDEYDGFEFEIYGDPTGGKRSDTDESTPFDILEAAGISAQPAPTNDFIIRREAIAVPLSRLIDGKPGLIISPKCVITRKGLAGGYHYKRIRVSGAERYYPRPLKNKYSHPVEAGGYLMVGAGEGGRLVRTPLARPAREPEPMLAESWML